MWSYTCKTWKIKVKEENRVCGHTFSSLFIQMKSNKIHPHRPCLSEFILLFNKIRLCAAYTYAKPLKAQTDEGMVHTTLCTTDHI